MLHVCLNGMKAEAKAEVIKKKMKIEQQATNNQWTVARYGLKQKKNEKRKKIIEFCNIIRYSDVILLALCWTHRSDVLTRVYL